MAGVPRAVLIGVDALALDQLLQGWNVRYAGSDAGPGDRRQDEGRGTIRTGHGPEDIAALRRLAMGILKARARDTVYTTIQRLARNTRLVFDYLHMTRNSQRRPKPRPRQTTPAG